MNCQYCQAKCQKAGKQSSGIQKYYCKDCTRYQQAVYKYKACKASNKALFLKCLKVGNSLSGIRYITGIAKSTQIRWIRKTAKTLKPSNTFVRNDIYELDELCTYVKSKTHKRWVISAISRKTGRVVEVKVGTRTTANLKLVVDKLLQLSPKAIYTDKLPAYKGLIPSEIHKMKHRGINKIERFHLNLRTHIKPLNRRTICFSKKQEMLENLICIYVYK